MHSYLHEAGRAWDRKVAQAVLEGKPMSVRLAEAFKGVLEQEYARKTAEFLAPHPYWAKGGILPKCGRTLRERSLAFRMLSKGAGALWILVRLESSAFPDALGMLLHADEDSK